MKVLKLSHSPLDVRSGKWTDLSRFGNHGIPHGGARPVMIAPGGVWGFEFDGSSGYVDCGTGINEPAQANAITIAFWIIPKDFEALGPEEDIITKWAGSWGVWKQKGTKSLIMYMRNDVPESFGGVKISPLTDNKLHYITFTYDGFVQKGYINAVLKGQEDCPDTIASSHDHVFIGMANQEYFLNGVVAQPVIEDRAWSQGEIRENMYRSPIYRMLRGLPRSFVYVKVPWKRTEGEIYRKAV